MFWCYADDLTTLCDHICVFKLHVQIYREQGRELRTPVYDSLSYGDLSTSQAFAVCAFSLHLLPLYEIYVFAGYVEN